ncbi:MAG: hypothetical protein L0229_02780 [Blastocatellia bacterium]|nr:hypothetical protein [Blastocatellia bacterium]
MGLFEIYTGHKTWESYLGDQNLIRNFTSALESQGQDSLAQTASSVIKVELSKSDYQIAMESGLGALGPCSSGNASEPPCSMEMGLDKLAGGIDLMGADFNLLIGDIIWQLEMQRESLVKVLRRIRLPEFERKARAYRTRAERAYYNGWHEEALADFLEAEKRNYPDFSVHRSIASISFYHILDLPRALDYFRKAAKYARPSDARQSSEAHYFAGMVCAVEQRFKEAFDHLTEAVNLNPDSYEAHYQRASFAALLGDGQASVAGLERAVKGDPRYYERVRTDPSFDSVRPRVQELLDRLLEPVYEKLDQVKQDAEVLKRYIIARPEKRQRVSSIFQSIDRQVSEAGSYQAGLRFLDTLSQLQSELREIYDLFYKHYEIDTRDYVRSIAFSPDGRLVASGFVSEGIKVWEVDTGRKLQSLKGHASSVNSVAFSPDSLRLASGSRDRTIKLWDIAAGQEIRTLGGHDGEVRAVTFSPDGRWLASASHDRTVKLWGSVTGREVQTFEGHVQQVTSAAFSPDGCILASGSLDRTVRLWDVTTGREIRTLEGHTRGVESVAFSSDGRLLASGGEDKLVKLWDVATGREAQTLSGHRNDVTSVAFSPDGELLAAGSLGQTVRLWRLGTGRVVKTLWYKEISWNQVAFSPRGQWLALASRDLQLWSKVILTPEEYAEAKAREERALQSKREADWLAEEQAAGESLAPVLPDEELRADRRVAGQCEVCGTKLRLFAKVTGRVRCKAHRIKRSKE